MRLEYFYSRIISNSVGFSGVFGMRGVSLIIQQGLFSKLTFRDAIITTRDLENIFDKKLV